MNVRLRQLPESPPRRLYGRELGARALLRRSDEENCPMKRRPEDALIMTGGCLVLMLGAWAWQHAMRHPSLAALAARESLEHVRTRFPVPEPLTEAPTAPADFVGAVTRANPFSPQRQPLTRSATASSTTGAASTESLAPQFVYKGRIVMGTAQRAVLEDTTTRKTYFLQVGQEAIGFKVLDIADTQVTLANLHTHEELVIPLPSSASSAPTKELTKPANKP